MLSQKDFEYENYIGDWVKDFTIKLSKEVLFEEVKTILDNRNEFDYTLPEIIQACLERNLNEDELFSLFGIDYFTNELDKRYEQLLKEFGIDVR